MPYMYSDKMSQNYILLKVFIKKSLLKRFVLFNLFCGVFVSPGSGFRHGRCASDFLLVAGSVTYDF
jgi:hypothetical protein